MMSASRWTPLELVRWTTGYFEKHGVPSPRLDAELLLAHVLDAKRIDLYLRFEQSVDEASRARFRELVRRRAEERVPVAYLTGCREFWSLSFVVNGDVLIPRPETETLVQAILDLAPVRWAEIGTGSGAVAAAVALERPGSRGVAVDCSPAALEIARANLARLGALDRVELRAGDGVAPLGGRFDVIASNPPYIRTAELGSLPAEVQHEPAAALDGGPDGMRCIDALVREAPARLRTPGRVVLEVGAGQAAEVEQRLRGAGAAAVEVRKDLAGIERVVIGTFGEGEVANGPV
jgi:release factor glutamine methyltransferase